MDKEKLEAAAIDAVKEATFEIDNLWMLEVQGIADDGTVQFHAEMNGDRFVGLENFETECETLDHLALVQHIKSRILYGLGVAG